MAFIDTLVSDKQARVVLVDRNHQPGGHWTTACPFVRLHQPSALYGVDSLNLASDTIDQVLKRSSRTQARRLDALLARYGGDHDRLAILYHQAI